MRIDVLDLNFQGIPEAVASFLVHAPEGPLLVECGPSTTRDRLLEDLARHGIGPKDLKGILLTHIHLDHAGSAGYWASHGVPIYVHDQGAPHLVDPTKLVASATRIYQDRMQTLWGEIPPVPGEMVRALQGDQTLQIAGLEVSTLETPGHARHHHAFAIGDVIFTGDVAAVSLPVENPFLSIPAPPPEFDLEMWLASIEKLLAHPAKALYLTHFGRVENPKAHFEQLRERLPVVTAFVGERRDWDHAKLVEAYYDLHRQMGLPEAQFEAYEKANPLFMSVDGLLRYWKKRSS